MLGASTLELTLRMVVGLVVVVGLLLAAMRLARNRLGEQGDTTAIAVRARQQLTRSTSAMVLEVGTRRVLIAVSDDNVTVLAEGDDLVAPASPPEPSARGGGSSAKEFVDLGAKEPDATADGVSSGARKPHGRSNDSLPSGKNMIDALRERTIRRG